MILVNRDLHDLRNLITEVNGRMGRGLGPVSDDRVREVFQSLPESLQKDIRLLGLEPVTRGQVRRFLMQQ